MSEIVNTYPYPAHTYDRVGGSYRDLTVPDVPASPLNIPPLLTPDSQDEDSVEYTVQARTGETQFLPGKKTKTWGYNEATYLGPTIVYKDGQHAKVHLKNDLPEFTTFHWHGLHVPGPYVDGGCHAPVHVGETSTIEFDVNQPAATLWLHAHSCPTTSEQVWNGLASMVLVQDETEAAFNFPREYGVDDLPVILQDRTFHADNQFDYRKDYSNDGTKGQTPVINGTVKPYFEVTTQRIRLRLLNGSNRREWRLHLSEDTPFAQIAGDGGLLPETVWMDRLMLTCAERAEIIIDFKDYKPGDTVQLYSDYTTLITFKIGEFTKEDDELPTTLVPLNLPEVSPDTPEHQAVMSGEDEYVMINDKKFVMDEINDRQQLGEAAIWYVTNKQRDDMMIHPFHMHGGSFYILERDGKKPYPNELGPKDTVGVAPNETVKLLVQFNQPGVFMYHCHILEHEDGGMMAQIEVYDPDHPKEYDLITMKEVEETLAKDRGVAVEDLWMPGMDSYHKLGMKM